MNESTNRTRQATTWTAEATAYTQLLAVLSGISSGLAISRSVGCRAEA